MDIKASLRFKWRAPWGGALPGESLKSYVRRLANTVERQDAALARAWLERKGCCVGPAGIPVRGNHSLVAVGYDPAAKASTMLKEWRGRC